MVAARAAPNSGHLRPLSPPAAPRSPPRRLLRAAAALGAAEAAGSGGGGGGATCSGGGSGGDDGGPPSPPRAAAPLAALRAVAGALPLLAGLAAHAAAAAARAAGAAPAAPPHLDASACAAAAAAAARAAAALGVESEAELRDLLNAVSLSEAIYEIYGASEAAALRHLGRLKAAAPPGAVTLRRAQLTAPHVRDAYLLAEDDGALVVAFMGTSYPRDMLANAALWAEEVRLDVALLGAGEEPLPGVCAAAGGGPAPAAHRGFLGRARAVPVEALYAAARARGKRLVLTGHSLGGAVATLAAMSLMAKLPRERHADVSCFAFASPAAGNAELAAVAEAAGWTARIRNYLAPDDPIPRLLGSAAAAAPAEAAPAAEVAAAAAHPLAAAATTVSAASGSLVAAMRRAVPGGRAREEPPDAAAAAAPATEEKLPAAAAAAAPAAEDAAADRRGFFPSLGAVPPAAARLAAASARTALGAASAAGAAARAAAAAAATVPARAAPNLSPLGRQLWIAPGGVVASVQLATEAAAATGAAAAARPAPPEAPAAEGPAEDAVDVAVAAAAAAGALPSAPPPGALFPSHRMVSYRARLMALAAEALGGAGGAPVARAPAWVAALPRADSVLRSELLAPGCFPLRAAATPLEALPAAPSLGSAVATLGAPARRLWRRALGRALPADDSARVNVAIRVEGRGLSNATAAWITGASTDASGRAAPLAVEVVARPAPPAPAAAGARAHPALEPIAAAASWVAQAAGWVPLLGRLQPAGSGDALLLRASLPGETLRRAAEAARDPLAAAVGDAPRLELLLETDFGLQALPLEVRPAADGPGGAGTLLRGGAAPAPERAQRQGRKRLPPIGRHAEPGLCTLNFCHRAQ